jgi:hypothetical protein
MNISNNLNIDEGTISFWTPENKLQFNDGKTTPLLSINPEGGNIFILKDDDNKLKVFLVALNKGRVDLEHDISKLDSSNKHMIVVTWSLKTKELSLYIDGNKASTKEIIF